MHHLEIWRALAITIALTGCGIDSASGTTGGGDDGTGDDGSGDGPPALEIVSKDVMLAPGQEATYCYYFHTPNTTKLSVTRWVSRMTPGSHHAILYTNPLGTQPADGTIDQNGCGLGGSFDSANIPVWTYATQIPDDELDLPADDGTGKPLAQVVQPNTAAFFQLHYLNATDDPVSAHIDLKAYALAADAEFTQTDAYVTYNNDILLTPGATNVDVSASCPLPLGAKFWTLSTHSHKQSFGTDIADGSSMVFTSSDWEHPGVKSWKADPFYTFSSPLLTWDCKYNNTGDNKGSTVVAGASAQTNEMCMATAYFFPSTGPIFQFRSGGTCIPL